nr:hypothetical protein [Massilia sp. PDC64]
MDLHVIEPGREPDLVARVVDGQLIIVPPTALAPAPAAVQAGDTNRSEM